MMTGESRNAAAFREETATLIGHCREDISSGWIAGLRAEWGEHADDRISLLQEEQRLGQDLLTMVVKSLRAPPARVKSADRHLLDKVRTRRYSVLDLFMEVCCLEQSIQEVLGGKSELNQVGLVQAMALVSGELRHALKNVIRDTSDIYEHVLERSNRAFCQVDEEGRIVYANAEFTRLTGCEEPTGRNLASFFDDPQAKLVADALRGPKPVLRPLCIRTGNGRRVAVGADIGPLNIGGDNRGGYAGLVDISGPMELQTRIFDRSPLGITKVNLNQEFTYANPTVLRLLRTNSLAGKHIRDIFDEENYAEVQNQLLRRMKGESSEYGVKFKRLSDGKLIPAMLAAMPDIDLQGTVVGAVCISRPVLLEETSAEIHRRVHTLRDGRQILAAVAEVIGGILAFDLFSVSVYSADRQHARELFSCRPGGAFESPRRWWLLTDSMVQWIDQNRESFDGDLTEYLSQERWQPLREDRAFQPLLDAGVRFFMTMPVVRADRVVASVTVFCRDRFNEDDVAILKRLPLDHAVLMALNSEEEKDLRFRLDLVANVSLISSDLERVAKIVVNALAERYGWTNVGIYQVDQSSAQIRLLSQCSASAECRLPPGSTQPINQGVLGYVYHRREAVNITNVWTDPRFKGDSRPPVPGAVSVLCLPIVGEDRVRWLLNVEDAKENAFAPEEERALEILLAELAGLLERSRKHHFLRAVLESVSDAILVTDERDTVRSVNPAVKRLLGYSETEMVGQPLRQYFRDEQSAASVLAASGNRTDSVWLRQKDGKYREVLLSVSRLPGEGGGRVFTAKDLLPYQRSERLEALERMYAEIASQTKTPLSLAFTWLQRLAARGGPADTADTLRKVQQQLGHLGLTYDRLFLAEGTGLAVPYHEVLLDLSEIVAAVRRDLPEAELKSVDIECQEHLPHVRGDLYQLWFCVMTILSYLLRFVPEDKQLRLLISGGNGQATIELIGYLPEVTDLRGEQDSSRMALAKGLADMALGQETIRRFVANHRGTFHEPTRQGDAVRFRIDLPAAGET